MMKTIIFYRSAYKGNTLKIAQKMAEVLGAGLVSTDTNPEVDVSEYDLIGFGSAINFAAHDVQLLRFAEKQNLKDKDVFIFSTRCRPYLGGYHKALRKIIRDRGGVIAGEFSCRGYDRTGPWVLMDGCNKARPDGRDLFKAGLFAEKLRRKLHPLADIYGGPVEGHIEGVPTRRKGSDVVAGDKVVFLDTSTCVGCGKCMDVCPMHVFGRRNGRMLPVHDRDCILCRICADRCPTSSILIHESLLNSLRIGLCESGLRKSYNR